MGGTVKTKKDNVRDGGTLLEDMLYDRFQFPGVSFLEIDNNYGPGNLYSFMAKEIRNWVSSGGDIYRTKRLPEYLSGRECKRQLSKYYRSTSINTPNEHKP